MLGNSIRVGTIKGVEVKVHPTFGLIVLWVVYQWGYVADAGLRGIVFGSFVVSAVFACVLAHEMGHALIAKRYGLSVHDVTLLPIGGVARIEHGPLTPRTETVIALAGPMVNVFIAGLLSPVVIAVAVVTSIGEALGYLIYAEQLSVIGFVIYLWIANLVLALFNLIPAFPMDGGRILRAQLAARRGRLVATHYAVVVGQIFALLVAVLGVISGNFMLLLVTLFIVVYAQIESRNVNVETRLRHLPAGVYALWDSGGIPPTSTVAWALRGGPRDLVVTDQGRVIGMLWRRDLMRHLNGAHHDLVVRDIMDRQVHVVDANDSVYDVQVWMSETTRSAVPVVEDGQYRGIITGDRLLHVYQTVGDHEWQRYRLFGRSLVQRLRSAARQV
ncbi:MAG: site-2 protease family protein [Thermomicrobiales bacterium]